MTSLRRDLACSLLLLIIAIGYYAVARNIGQTALSDAIGPAGLPRVYAGALAMLAVAIGAAAWLRHRLAEPTAPESAGPAPARRLGRGAGAAAIGIAYLATVSIIGYPFAIALTIAAMAVYQGERLSLRVMLVAAAGAATLFVLFDWLLGVTLPAPWNG